VGTGILAQLQQPAGLLISLAEESSTKAVHQSNALAWMFILVVSLLGLFFGIVIIVAAVRILRRLASTTPRFEHRVGKIGTSLDSSNEQTDPWEEAGRRISDRD